MCADPDEERDQSHPVSLLRVTGKVNINPEAGPGLGASWPARVLALRPHPMSPQDQAVTLGQNACQSMAAIVLGHLHPAAFHSKMTLPRAQAGGMLR